MMVAFTILFVIFAPNLKRNKNSWCLILWSSKVINSQVDVKIMILGAIHLIASLFKYLFSLVFHTILEFVNTDQNTSTRTQLEILRSCFNW